MITPGSIPLGKRILLSFGIAWLASVSLGNIYGALVVGKVSIADLWVMQVIQVATIVASVIAVLLTPLIAWGLRRYAVIKWIFILWLLAVVWVLVGVLSTHNGAIVLAGALLLTVGGLVGIRFMANR